MDLDHIAAAELCAADTGEETTGLYTGSREYP